MNKHTKCLVCESEKLKPLNNYYEKHKLVKCTNCNFVFMEEIPTIEDLNSHYSNYSYDKIDLISNLTIKSYHKLLDEFEKYRKHNRILDVGCGRGWFLQEAKKRGWEVSGTEFSETAVKLCESTGIKMKSGKLKTEMFSNLHFDIITSFEVLEHIDNPNEDIDSIYKLLRKGGLFYCTTPNFNSIMRYYLNTNYNVICWPEHLSYYTKSTLNRVVEQSGFKNIKFLSTGISISRIESSKKKKMLKNEDDLNSSKIDSDEKLREKISKKWHLALAKNIVNYFLTLTNTGLTLKGYYIKK